MPTLNGFETLNKVKEMFTSHNFRLSSQGDPRGTYLLRPLIVFFSQLEPQQFDHFFTEDERPDFYLQKPLALRELYSLLRLLNLT